MAYSAAAPSRFYFISSSAFFRSSQDRMFGDDADETAIGDGPIDIHRDVGTKAQLGSIGVDGQQRLPVELRFRGPHRDGLAPALLIAFGMRKHLDVLQETIFIFQVLFSAVAVERKVWRLIVLVVGENLAIGIDEIAHRRFVAASVDRDKDGSIAPAQAKNLTWENQGGGLHCAAKGKLKELVSDPYKCYLNLDECKASVDTLSGKIDPGFVQLFAGESGPLFVELLAIRGLGYTRDVKYAPLLTRIVEGARAEKVGNGLRTAVAEALTYMSSKAAAESAYANLLTVKMRDPEYKRVILAMLGRWKSDAGVASCTGALTNNDDKKMLESCIYYLGQRQVKAVIPVLQRKFEQNETETLRAYGLMGDKSLLKDITAFLDEKDGQPYRVRLPAVVAAIAPPRAP